VLGSCVASSVGSYDKEFALACLQELPQQFKKAKELGLLGRLPACPPLPAVPKPKPPPAAPVAAAPPRAATPEPEKCAVCMDQPRNAVLVPCGHAVLCMGCAGAIMDRRPRKCPICRQEPQSHFRLFS
jgi:hypothetical protein